VALLVLRGVGFVCRAKPNVPLVGLAKIVFKKFGSAKKIKHEALGCRVGKKSAVKLICRPVVSIIVYQLMDVVLFITLANNIILNILFVIKFSGERQYLIANLFLLFKPDNTKLGAQNYDYLSPIK